MNWAVVSIVLSVIALGVAWYFYNWVTSQPEGTKESEKVGKLIRNGAETFLKREYKVLTKFVGIMALLMMLFLPQPIWTHSPVQNIWVAVAYILGSLLSAIAGKVGMDVATIANVKASNAAKDGIKPAFNIGFRGGAVMGMAVVAICLLGTSAIYLVTGNSTVSLAFSFGASSLALFAKAGGGIYTKTADISADLVGKVELGIPEDDPRNPAVIADNVGDNVGDVAGMGADLLDSNVAAITAAIVIGYAIGQVQLVFCYSALGLLASILGVLCVRIGKNGDPSNALNNGTYITTLFFAALTLIASLAFGYQLRIWGATVVGLLVGIVIGITSDYFTSDDKNPVKQVALASKTGPAFTILTGLSYGLVSTFPALAGIGVASLVAYKLCEPLGGQYPMFGISMAAVGMLSIVGMVVSNDAYGPIVDNARGIAEMTDLGDDVLDVTDQLDSAGNTAKAITKGFAIGAAGLTVIALLGTYSQIVQEATGVSIAFNMMDPMVFFGALIGLAVPAVFSAMLMLGVNHNAEGMVGEIHRQFKTIPGLKEGKSGVSPEYDKCIDIATVGALKELIPAGVMAIVTTLAVGFIGGINAIGGFLAGNIMSGILLAELMSNAGGLWDNSKKYVESGNMGGKGSDAHKAAVIGDTVGDPLKDTAGPSLNTQITVVSLIASLAAQLFIRFALFR